MLVVFISFNVAMNPQINNVFIFLEKRMVFFCDKRMMSSRGFFAWSLVCLMGQVTTRTLLTERIKPFAATDLHGLV